MKNNESYRSSENRKDRRRELIGLAVIVTIALGVRLWSETHKPPVHPLKMTVLERGIPKTPLHSISEHYYPEGEFYVTDNMRELAGEREIEGGETTWELVDIKQRTSEAAPWAPPVYPKARIPLVFPIKIQGAGEKLSYGQIHWFANHVGEWKIVVRALRSYYDPNTKEEWKGSGEYIFTRLFKEDIAGAKRTQEIADRRARGLPDPTPTPMPGDRPLDPNKKYIAKMQWSSGDGKVWHDIPQKGEKGFPLTLEADLITGFRAVKLNPKEPWPDWAGDPGDPDSFDHILGWSGDIAPPGGLNGEEVWIEPKEQNAISADKNDLKTISVTCSNTITRQIYVTPPRDE